MWPRPGRTTNCHTQLPPVLVVVSSPAMEPTGGSWRQRRPNIFFLLINFYSFLLFNLLNSGRRRLRLRVVARVGVRVGVRVSVGESVGLRLGGVNGACIFSSSLEFFLQSCTFSSLRWSTKHRVFAVRIRGAEPAKQQQGRSKTSFVVHFMQGLCHHLHGHRRR